MDYLKQSDEDLVAYYLAGDANAFSSLVFRYSDHIYNFARKLGAKNDATDIVQEVFVKVWDNLKKFDTNKSFKTWIFTIARNTTTDFLRKKKILLFSDIENNSVEENEVNDIPDPGPISIELLQKVEDAKHLEEILFKLDSKSREVLSLYYQEEMTFVQIGEVLNQSINTVKSIHRRALIKLRELLHQN